MRQVSKVVDVNSNTHQFYSSYCSDDDSYSLWLRTSLTGDKAKQVIQVTYRSEVKFPYFNEMIHMSSEYDSKANMFRKLSFPVAQALKEFDILPDGFVFEIKSIPEGRMIVAEHDSEFLAAEFAYFEAVVNSDPEKLDKFVQKLVSNVRELGQYKPEKKKVKVW